MDENVTNLMEEKWQTLRKRAAIGRRNTPHHSYTSGSKKFLLAYVILF